MPLYGYISLSSLFDGWILFDNKGMEYVEIWVLQILVNYYSGTEFKMKLFVVQVEGNWTSSFFFFGVQKLN